MSAKELMASMLDELMGTARDGEVEENSIRFNDKDVCKSYISGLCPYELFRNTKLDLGTCNRYHNPALKADFEIASKDRDYGYNVDQLEHLSAFIKDCDKKVEINRRRLEDKDEKDLGPEASAVHELNEQIGKKLAEIEVLGADGKVDESMALMKEVDELKQDKRKAEDIFRNSIPASATQQQKLRVCEVCAAYLSLYDNDRRLADHFGGKLHMGFIKIRDRRDELEIEVTKQREERELEREKNRLKRREEDEKRRLSRNNRSPDRRDSRRSDSYRSSSKRSNSRERQSSRRDRDGRRRDYDNDRRGSSRSSRRSRSRSRSR